MRGQHSFSAELGEVEQGNGRSRQMGLQRDQGLRCQPPLMGPPQPLAFRPAGQHDQAATALAGQGNRLV